MASRPKPKGAGYFARRAAKGVYGAVAILALRPGEADPKPLRQLDEEGFAAAARLPKIPQVTFDVPSLHTRRRAESPAPQDSDDVEWDPQVHYDQQPDLLTLFEVADPLRDPVDPAAAAHQMEIGVSGPGPHTAVRPDEVRTVISSQVGCRLNGINAAAQQA